MKRIITLSLLAFALMVITFVGVRLYLHSARTLANVTRQIADAYGGPVTIDRVDIGLMSTTICGLRVFEPGADVETAKPWLTAHSVVVDEPLWRLGRGDISPSRIGVQAAEILLRFDEKGNLITRFPTRVQTDKQSPLWDEIPPITIEQAKVILRQDRRGDLAADNIRAEVAKKGGEFVLSGDAESQFGNLTLSGSFDKKALMAQVRVKTDSAVHVTQNLLEHLPFVPAGIFQELKIERADATGSVALTFDLAKKSLRYHVDLAASNATLSMPGVGLAVQGGSANVILDDNLIKVRGAQGHALGGVIFAEGDLALHGPDTHLTLSSVKVENLDIGAVPQSWGIPTTVRKSIASGKLFGTATVNVSIGDVRAMSVAAATLVARAAPDLSVRALLHDAVLFAAFPHDEIRIESQGKGEVRDPAGKFESIEFDWQLSPSAAHVRCSPNRGAPSGNLFALFTTLTLVGADLPAQDVEPKLAAAKYSELKFSLKNASLAELIKNENLKLPFPSDGKISLQLKASIPLDRLDDLKAYRAKGSAQIKQLTVAGMKLEEVSADFTLRYGVLNFDSLHGAFAKQGAKIGDEGALSGSGQILLAPLGEMRADLKLDKIPLAKIAGQSTDLIQGNLSGMLSIRGNADKLQDANGLEAEGRIVGSPLNIYGIGVDEFATSLKLKDGLLSFPGLQARIEGELITPTASLQLKDDQSVVAKIALETWDLSAIRKIAAVRQISIPPVTGMLRAEAVLQSKPAPVFYALSGDIETKNLKIAADALDNLRLHWELDGNNVNLNAALYDGKMAGTASLPRSGKDPGKLDLHVQGVDVKRLAKHLRIPVAIEGNVDGTLKATFTPVAKDRESDAVFRVDFTSPRLRVQNIPTDKLQGTLEYQRGKIGYNLTGSSLGGSFDLQGQIPGDADAAKPKGEKGKEGRLRIKNIRLGQLLDALGASAARDMRGRANLDLPFSHNTTDRFPRGKGKLRVTDVQWGDLLLTESISAEILLADHQLRVHNLEGDLAQGTLSGRLAFDFRDPERSRFSLNLDGVESGYLLAPWLEKKMEGSMQARIRGRLGRTWTGTADIALAHGKFSGLEFSDWRLPIGWSFAPTQGRAQAEIQETTAQFARGRANGKLKISWDNSARVEGFLRLDRVELGELLRQTIGSSSLGAGRTTAKLDIKGTDVRSLNELEGNLVATFEQAQALQVPVLQQISPFLGLSPSTTFQKGTLNARLERGTAKIKQLTLQGNNVQVHIDGTVNLREQLNLHVIARTGDIGWPTVRLGPIGVRVPVAGPVPLVVLQEVSALISNHVVYLDVTGTPASSTIRPRPLQTLSAEAARFFLNPSNSPITLDP